MWTRAQALTRFLLKVWLPEHSCVCNPSLNKVTLTHVCPFYRQIAMLATRSAMEVFLPWPADRGALEAMLHHSHRNAACATLMEAVHSRQVRMILRDPALQEFLREHCVLCGGAFHPALLRDHVLQVHASKLEDVIDLLPFLYEEYTQAAHTDHQCAQCNQIFNLPLLGDPPLSEQHARQTLVLAHFQQCPVIHQLCLLLQHGRPRRSDTDRPGSSGTSGCLRSHGPPAEEIQPGNKRRRKGSQEGQDAAQAQGDRPASRPPPGGTTDGQTPTAPGRGSESDEKTRLFRLLHANGARVSDPRAERQGQDMACRGDPTDGPNEDSRLAAASSHTDAYPCPDLATPLDEALPEPTLESTLSDSSAAQAFERQRGVLLSQVGHGQSISDPDRSNTGAHGTHEEVCGPIGGEHNGPCQHDQISQPEAL